MKSSGVEEMPGGFGVRAATAEVARLCIRAGMRMSSRAPSVNSHHRHMAVQSSSRRRPASPARGEQPPWPDPGSARRTRRASSRRFRSSTRCGSRDQARLPPPLGRGDRHRLRDPRPVGPLDHLAFGERGHHRRDRRLPPGQGQGSFGTFAVAGDDLGELADAWRGITAEGRMVQLAALAQPKSADAETQELTGDPAGRARAEGRLMAAWSARERQRVVDAYLNESGHNQFVPREFLAWLWERRTTRSIRSSSGWTTRRRRRRGARVGSGTEFRTAHRGPHGRRRPVDRVEGGGARAAGDDLSCRRARLGGGYTPRSIPTTRRWWPSSRRQAAGALDGSLGRHGGVAELAGVDTTPIREIAAHLAGSVAVAA